MGIIYGAFARGLIAFALYTLTACLILHFLGAMACGGVLLMCLFSALLRFRAMRKGLQRRRRKAKAGFIYVFTDIGLMIPVVKIGRESTRYSRTRSHRTAAPFGILIPVTIAVDDALYAEKYLHHRYKFWRVSPNNEWFYLFSPRMLFEILLMNFMGKRR